MTNIATTTTQIMTTKGSNHNVSQSGASRTNITHFRQTPTSPTGRPKRRVSPSGQDRGAKHALAQTIVVKKGCQDLCVYDSCGGQNVENPAVDLAWLLSLMQSFFFLFAFADALWFLRKIWIVSLSSYQVYRGFNVREEVTGVVLKKKRFKSDQKGC